MTEKFASSLPPPQVLFCTGDSKGWKPFRVFERGNTMVFPCER